MSVLFFEPIAKKAIWGNTLVNEYFGYHHFPLGVGQVWGFSGLKEESTICLSAPYKGMTLYELWENHQNLFGNKQGEFPVIISLVAPEDDLSIQVHPDDEYAKKIGYSSGKNEAWYFIEAEENANIVYGHCAKDKEELLSYIKEDKWYELIKYLEVKKDDFVYLPAGLLHALKKGSIVYEIQQATDITYRFFDYHRKDHLGNERELHLEQAIDCLSYNQEAIKNKIAPNKIKEKDCLKTIYISNDSFTVMKVDITGNYLFKDKNYQLATVIRGNGKVNNEDIKVGDNFLIPTNQKVCLSGHMTIMMTTKES